MYSRIKIVVLGEKNIGKTSLLRRLIDNKFYLNEAMTIGVDYLNKKIKHLGDNNNINLDIWDTSGGLYYIPLVVTCCKIDDIDILFYIHEINDSYSNFLKWESVIFSTFNPKNIVVFFTKNDTFKKDNKNEIVKIKNRCFDNNLLFFETSAKKGLNVSLEEIINILIK